MLRSTPFFSVFGAILIVIISLFTWLSGYTIAKTKYQVKLAPFKEYTQRYERGDYIIGQSPTGIQYWGYDSGTKTIAFKDDATGSFIKVENDSNVVVFDPLTNNLQDRSFSINNITFIKSPSFKSDKLFILECSVHPSFYNEAYDNVTFGISDAYKKGVDEGYAKGVNESIDYDKLNLVTFDGGGLDLPRNYGIQITRDSLNGLVFAITKNQSTTSTLSGYNYILRNWNFSGDEKE